MQGQIALFGKELVGLVVHGYVGALEGHYYVLKSEALRVRCCIERAFAHGFCGDSAVLFYEFLLQRT